MFKGKWWCSYTQHHFICLTSFSENLYITQDSNFINVSQKCSWSQKWRAAKSNILFYWKSFLLLWLLFVFLIETFVVFCSALVPSSILMSLILFVLFFFCCEKILAWKETSVERNKKDHWPAVSPTSKGFVVADKEASWENCVGLVSMNKLASFKRKPTNMSTQTVLQVLLMKITRLHTV